MLASLLPVISESKKSSDLIPFFNHQPHKMVKHTQKLRQLLLTNCLSVFDHFLGLALKGLNLTTTSPSQYDPMSTLV